MAPGPASGSELPRRRRRPNESTEGREARIACTRAWIRSLGANPDDKPIYTKHRLIPTSFENPYAPKKKADDAEATAAEPAAEPDAGEAAAKRRAPARSEEAAPAPRRWEAALRADERVDE